VLHLLSGRGPSSTLLRASVALAAPLALAAALSGCVLGQLVGGMAASAQRSGSKTVAAKYSGLADKSFAVVVYADRIIQADYPEVVGDLTVTIARRLADQEALVAASGFVPGERVLQYQYSNPRWVVMPWRELGEQLGVQRLIIVELQEFRLNDPGNQYTWAGVASGAVRVVELDGPSPETPVFQETVTVRFPDEDGYGPMQMPASTIQLALSKRLVDRASWLFYEHDEANSAEY
jgi:hypothetical protein